jgi:uncharacterized protein YcbX
MLGKVTQLWRYPVKSMAGERLQRTFTGLRGIPGDRGWAVRDEKVGEIRGAKKIPQLMQCSARYLQDPTPASERMPAAEIVFPNGERILSDDTRAAEVLSKFLGRAATLWPLQPTDALDHYKRGIPDHADLMDDLREIFGRLPEEPMPDLSAFPPDLLSELMQYTSPLGTYFDAFPIHILTTATLSAMKQLRPASEFDVRRFRPNLLIETVPGFEGLVEQNWCGKNLRIGSALIKIEMPCVRCVMTTLPHHDLPKDPGVLRTIVRDAAQNLGVYATIAKPGEIAVGDPVALEAV